MGKKKSCSGLSKRQLATALVLGMTLANAPVGVAAEPNFVMEEIIVSADAYRTAIAPETVDAAVVSPGRAMTVPELLRQTAGIDIQVRSAGDNHDGMVKLRGSDAKRFTLLVDGVPVGMAGVMGGNYMDWNAIPLDNVEKIQIMKGAKSAAHGNTIGGTINIITKKNLGDKMSGTATLMTGENGRRQYLFNYGGRKDRLSWRVLYNEAHEDAFLLNNDYKNKQHGLSLGYAVTERDDFEVRYNRTKAKRGYIIGNNPGVAWYNPSYPIIAGSIIDGISPAPGGGYSAPLRPGAYWEKDLKRYEFAWKHHTDSGDWALTYWKNDEQRREVNMSTTGQVEMDRVVPSDKSRGWQLNATHKQGAHNYGFGFDYRQMRYGYGWYNVQPVANPSGIFPSQKADLLGVYVEDNRQINERWTSNIGLRYDSMKGRRDDPRGIMVPDKDYSGVSPKLNFSFKNNDTTATFIGLNRLWRAPSMAEFYWWKQMPTNPGKLGTGLDLKPEKGWEYEIGVARKVSDKYNTRVSLYYQDIKDFINFTHHFPFSVYNIDEAKLWGVEWQNNYRLNAKSSIIFNYTNQHTAKNGVLAGDNLGLKGELDYRPRHKLTLGYQYDAKPWQLRYGMDYTGSQMANYPYGSASSIRMGGYVVHNIAATYALRENSLLTLSVNNVFDKSYSEQYGYPTSGRWFGVSLQHKL